MLSSNKRLHKLRADTEEDVCYTKERTMYTSINDESLVQYK